MSIPSDRTQVGFDPEAVAQQMLDLDTPVVGADRPNLPVQKASLEVSGPTSPPPSRRSAGVLPHDLTDRANAELFASMYSGKFRYVDGNGWYVWEAGRWKLRGGEGAAIWAAGDMAAQMPTVDPTGVFSQQDVVRHRRYSSSTSGMKAMLHQAKASPALSLDATQLDGDPYTLCTPSGVVDLKTGEVRTADPFHDFNSRCTRVAPLTQMETPRFFAFLADTFGDDADGKEMIEYLHILLGYSITGDVGAQVLPFCHGDGANGKSVLLDLVVQILGDYAHAAPPGFLMDRGGYNEHSTELTELYGRRLVVCSELKATDKFNEVRMKQLTGGEPVTARRMRQDYFTFAPTHHLWLLGNHYPEVATGGHAFWRRLRLIPFERKVPDAKKIDNLARILVEEEGPGILAWLIEGARRFLATRAPGADRDNLDGPERVRTATAGYAATEDHIGRFLGEATEKHPSAKVLQSQLYKLYKLWCQGEEEKPATGRAFADRVRKELGLKSAEEMIKSNGVRFYPGLALRTEDE
ncbi:phage/plasmid primase, P4 family [Streptomyces sp. NPDC088745]|uniref:DNA primase family protein n=1 Tax=Streptomyces sp. NPDC088745 TaxID=3365884 RepID=UPI0037FF9719